MLHKIFMGSVVVILLCLLVSCKPPQSTQVSEKNLEIFTWWTTGGEAAALNKLYALYMERYPDVNIVNAAVPGSNADAFLASRVQGGDPPDSFQVMMGRTLIDTWVTSGKLEQIDDIYLSEGLEEVFPKGLLEMVSNEGHYYAIPTNIHRANLIWYNIVLFNQLGISNPPTTFEEWYQMADKCKAAGVYGLALGDVNPWTSVNLFETLLIGTLGAEDYKGLWTGDTSWEDPRIAQALDHMKQMLSYANPDHSALSWDQANQLIIEGQACTTVIGDWVYADNVAKDFHDAGWAPAPNNTGIYDALSDTFVLPIGAKHSIEARAWLSLIASREAQVVFNLAKGSICARIDCDPSSFGEYHQWAIQEWNGDLIVPSLANGAAANERWAAAITEAVNYFVTAQDIVAAQQALVQAANQWGPK